MCFGLCGTIIRIILRVATEYDKTDIDGRGVFSTESRLHSALKFLTECLCTYHGKQAIVLIDEYDAPLSNALMEG